MARRRVIRARTASRRVFARARASYGRRRSSGRSSGGSNVLMTIVAPAFAYGAIRAPLRNLVMPYVPNVLGENTDEVAMGLAGYLLMKNTTGFMHDLGKSALIVESASLGNNLVAPMISGMTTTNTATGGIYYQ